MAQRGPVRLVHRLEAPAPDLRLLQRLRQAGGWGGRRRVFGAGLSQRGAEHGGRLMPESSGF